MLPFISAMTTFDPCLAEIKIIRTQLAETKQAQQTASMCVERDLSLIKAILQSNKSM